jgi:putative transposase
MLQTRLGISQRRACRVVGQPRSSHRHEPAATTPADPDGPLRAELRAFARRHPRWGHRRALVALRAAGYRVNHKRCQRLWREEGLRVTRRARRKRAGTSTGPDVLADAKNVMWAIDFQFDSTTDGRPFKIANVIDEHTREALGGQVARSVTGEDLVAHLTALAADRGWPAPIRCDNAPRADLRQPCRLGPRQVHHHLHRPRLPLAKPLGRVVPLPAPR